MTHGIWMLHGGERHGKDQISKAQNGLKLMSIRASASFQWLFSIMSVGAIASFLSILKGLC